MKFSKTTMRNKLILAQQILQEEHIREIFQLLMKSNMAALISLVEENLLAQTL